jgi:phosphoserine aminotransferase
MQRIFNFAAGPAAIPLSVLQRSAEALVDYRQSGVGIGEISHRGKVFDAVLQETEARCRSVMGIGDDHVVLFLQGGATQQFELVPMNFLRGTADYLVTGAWAKKAAAAGKRYGKVNIVATSEATAFDRIPTRDTWRLTPGADYLHICSNNTIYGTRLTEFPDHPCLIADMSSEVASRVVDINRFGLIYAGAQKNLGLAGVVLVIIRKDLLAKAKEDLPDIFSYRKHHEAVSCLNTPPTFGVYVLLETFRWLEEEGGIAAVEARNERKARLIYDEIDAGPFYTGTVKDLPNRSRMNITFTLPNEELTTRFLKQAEALGMQALKGYRSVGGIRASVYNAMPVAGCELLAKHMREFAAAHG